MSFHSRQGTSIMREIVTFVLRPQGNGMPMRCRLPQGGLYGAGGVGLCAGRCGRRWLVVTTVTCVCSVARGEANQVFKAMAGHIGSYRMHAMHTGPGAGSRGGPQGPHGESDKDVLQPRPSQE